VIIRQRKSGDANIRNAIGFFLTGRGKKGCLAQKDAREAEAGSPDEKEKSSSFTKRTKKIGHCHLGASQETGREAGKKIGESVQLKLSVERKSKRTDLETSRASNPGLGEKRREGQGVPSSCARKIQELHSPKATNGRDYSKETSSTSEVEAAKHPKQRVRGMSEKNSEYSKRHLTREKPDRTEMNPHLLSKGILKVHPEGICELEGRKVGTSWSRESPTTGTLGTVHLTLGGQGQVCSCPVKSSEETRHPTKEGAQRKGKLHRRATYIGLGGGRRCNVREEFSANLLEKG